MKYKYNLYSLFSYIIARIKQSFSRKKLYIISGIEINYSVVIYFAISEFYVCNNFVLLDISYDGVVRKDKNVLIRVGKNKVQARDLYRLLK